MIEGPARRIQSTVRCDIEDIYSSQNNNNEHGMLLESGGCAFEGVSNYPETMNKSTLTRCILTHNGMDQIQPHGMVFSSNLWFRGN